MGDAMDAAQQFNEDAITDALRRHQARKREGLAVCEMLDCEAPIAPARTALGARLCLECQREREHQAQLRRRGV